MKDNNEAPNPLNFSSLNLLTQLEIAFVLNQYGYLQMVYIGMRNAADLSMPSKHWKLI